MSAKLLQTDLKSLMKYPSERLFVELIVRQGTHKYLSIASDSFSFVLRQSLQLYITPPSSPTIKKNEFVLSGVLVLL